MNPKQQTYEIEYRGDRVKIIAWLMENIPYHSLTPSRLSAVDADGNYVWRVNLANNNKVLFNDERTAILFSLRWS